MHGWMGGLNYTSFTFTQSKNGCNTNGADLFCFRIHLNISSNMMIPTYDSRISLMIYKLSPVAKLPSMIALFDT